MGAAVVDVFRLPSRQLPDMNNGVLALTDGPSWDEYDLEQLRDSGAVVCAYGRCAALVPPDHYWITDFGFFELLETMPSTNVYACPPIYEQREFAPQHHWTEAHWSQCTFHIAVEARRLFPDQTVYLLGQDGYHAPDWTIRPESHSRRLPQTARSATYPAASTRDTCDIKVSELETLILYQYEAQTLSVETWNLSPDSLYAGVWPVHPAVITGEFGHLSRTAAAVIVDFTGQSGVENLGEQGAMRYYFPSSGPAAAVEFVQRLRQLLPTSAIFVRVPPTFLGLADGLPSDVQIAVPGTPVDPNHRFRRCETYWLPSLDEST